MCAPKTRQDTSLQLPWHVGWTDDFCFSVFADPSFTIGLIQQQTSRNALVKQQQTSKNVLVKQQQTSKNVLVN